MACSSLANAQWVGAERGGGGGGGVVVTPVGSDLLPWMGAAGWLLITSPGLVTSNGHSHLILVLI